MLKFSTVGIALDFLEHILSRHYPRKMCSRFDECEPSAITPLWGRLINKITCFRHGRTPKVTITPVIAQSVNYLMQAKTITFCKGPSKSGLTQKYFDSISNRTSSASHEITMSSFSNFNTFLNPSRIFCSFA
jgi:hypothetical protein